MQSAKEYTEALDAIEHGMTVIAETHDIWQNRLIYALCHVARWWLIEKIKNYGGKKMKCGECKVAMECINKELVKCPFKSGMEQCRSRDKECNEEVVCRDNAENV